jgi:type II secretory pathway component PulF
MAFFVYQAFSKEGKKVSGIIEAKNLQVAKTELVKTGFYPIMVTLNSGKGSESFLHAIANYFSSPVSIKDNIFFTRQLAMLLKSGIALAESLNLMVDQTPAYMRPMVQSMRDDLKQGESFATVLARYPKSFSNLYIQLVKAGEASGQMEKVLLRIADFLEDEQEFDKTVSGALQGPLIQLFLVIAVAMALLTVIVPKLMDVITSLGNKELPLLTQIVIGASDFIVNHYLILTVSIVSIVIIFMAWKQSAWGRYIFDVAKLKIPLVSYFTRTIAVVQFSQTLGLLLESGVNIAEALHIVVQIVDNQVLVKMLTSAQENILKEGRVSDYLKKTGLFSMVDIHLINTGEQSGTLDVMLIQVGKYNQEDLKEYSSNLTAILNPLATVLLAVVVGVILFAVMGPIMEISNKI